MPAEQQRLNLTKGGDSWSSEKGMKEMKTGRGEHQVWELSAEWNAPFYCPSPGHEFGSDSFMEVRSGQDGKREWSLSRQVSSDTESDCKFCRDIGLL